MGANTVLMYIGMAAFLIVMLVIGIKASKKTTDLHSFAVAGRSFGPFVLAITITSTYGSASSYLGLGGMAFSSGWPMMWVWIGCMWGIVLPILLLGPKMRVFSERLGSTTMPDFIAKRFDDARFLRAFAAVVTVVFYTANIVAQFRGVGVLIGTAFDIDYKLAVVLFGLIIIFYCAAGGLFAVGWTDVVQGTFMMLIILFLVPISINASGGLEAMNQRLLEIGPEMTSIFGNGYTPLLAVFIVIFYSLLQMGQPNIGSRFFAIKKVKDFKKVLILTLFGTLLMSSVPWAGFAARILFPDIVADYAVPTMIMHYFPSVIAVISVIAIMCAMMTTIDGLLHSISTSIGLDLVRDTFGEKDERKVLLITRVSTIVAGLLAMICALFWYPQFLSMLVFGALAGVGSCTVGPILVGVFDRKANKVGATVGAVVSEALFCLLLLIFGSSVSIFYIGTPCMVLNIVLTVVVSRVAGKTNEELVNRLFAVKG